MGYDVKFTTIGGSYKAGDRRNSKESSKWQKQFDKIDVAPKDGVLSPQEIINYRDQQTGMIKRVLKINQFVTFVKGGDTDAYKDAFLKISKEEKETHFYREMLKLEQYLNEKKNSEN